jgi:translation initiation factor 4E
VELARFASLEQFWAAFQWLKPVKDLARDSSYHVFRRSAKPMWENFVHGGCIIVKLKKNGEGIDGYWQTLVAAAIGEYFEEPQIVGVGVGLRSKETCLSVWVATESMRVRTRLTEMIRVLLKVPVAALEWKKHAVSIADQSTFRNAEKLSKKSRKSKKSEKKDRPERTSQKDRPERTSTKSQKKEDKK